MLMVILKLKNIKKELLEDKTFSSFLIFFAGFFK